MKKYLFLLFLFFFYIILIARPKTKEVVLYDDTNKSDVVILTLKFENGINSKDLNKIFELYDKEYFITKINTKSNDILVSCDKFSDCINDIYAQKESKFEEDTIASGFKIDKLTIISHNDYITSFLKKYDISYEVS